MRRVLGVLRGVFHWRGDAESVGDDGARVMSPEEEPEEGIDILNQRVTTQLAKLSHQSSFDISILDYLEAFVGSMLVLFPDLEKQQPMRDYYARLKAYVKAYPKDLVSAESEEGRERDGSR